MPAPPPHPVPPAAATACAAWFGADPPDVGPPVGTGFSGSALLRVRPRGGAAWFVLKAFAAGTPLPRAEWVHALVGHLHDVGVTTVPRPATTRAGGTVAADGAGGLWELVPLVPGAPAAVPQPAQAVRALEALARIHVAAAAWPAAAPRVGPPPAVERRVEQARALAVRPWRGRLAAVRAAASAPAAGRWEQAIDVFEATAGDRAVAALAAARPEPVPLQAVLRDVWHAHVLFDAGPEARVAGIVDVHAAAIDAPATDLARLLGSWRSDPAAPAADPVATWPDAVAAYDAIRPLARGEARLVRFLHAAAVVCGLDNWFRWTCEERRGFATPAAVLDRVDRLLEELPAALAWLADGWDGRV